MHSWIREGHIFNWAHRGSAHEGPANTLFAMANALTSGADGIELDVHRTRDGKIVVIHDETATDTTDHGEPSAAEIAGMTWEELQQLDAAHWWTEGPISNHEPETDVSLYSLRGKAASDPSLRVPLLSDVLEAFPHVPVNIDLKRAGYEADVAELLRSHEATERVIVASFATTIRKFRGLAPEIATAASRSEIIRVARQMTLGRTWPEVPFVAAQIPKLSWPLMRPFVRHCRRQGIAVHVWTVDDEPLMERLCDIGVDGIMTNRSSVLASVLTRRGQTWSN